MPKNILLKKTCLLCKKTIVPIHNRRANGKNAYEDWDSREYHKK